jgi:hypothetical protein
MLSRLYCASISAQSPAATTITDDALARVVALGDGHPRATMLLIQQAHTGAVEELRREIDHALVVEGLERAFVRSAGEP